MNRTCHVDESIIYSFQPTVEAPVSLRDSGLGGRSAPAMEVHLSGLPIFNIEESSAGEVRGRMSLDAIAVSKKRKGCSSGEQRRRGRSGLVKAMRSEGGEAYCIERSVACMTMSSDIVIKYLTDCY